MKIRLRRFAHGKDLPLPQPASAGSAGLDLRAAVGEPRILAPGERMLVPTGIQLEIPRGWEAQVRPRSGLALRHGVTLLNGPGTIDSDYRGEVGVLLVNLGGDAYTIRRGERIAQLVVARVESVEWDEADRLSPSERGAGGFGSSGVG
ncbi:MAG: dUTP diphosphatase [bacterium]|nr:dUTP diphosphatase [bacterium]